MIESFRHKLRMFGVPLYGLANMFMENEILCKNLSVPESTLKNKHLSITHHRFREAVASDTIRISKEGI